MREQREISSEEAFQIIYVHTLLSRRWGITSATCGPHQDDRKKRGKEKSNYDREI